MSLPRPMRPFTLGMSGPVLLADFREFLHPGQWREGLPTGQGGTPVNLLCRELLRRGQRLVVFTCTDEVEHELVLEGPLLRLCVGPRGHRPARNFFRVARGYLAGAIARERPDVLHAQWTYEYALPVQRSGLPHLVTAHDAPWHIVRHNFIPYRIARTGMALRVISRASRVVSVSPHVAGHLRWLGYRGPDRVIPNGLPEQAFERAAGRPAARAGRAPCFATVLVGWGGYKNGQVAIEAFARVRRRHRDARLLMFGHGHGPAEAAAQWAQARGLEPGIEFVGQVPYATLIERLAGEVDILVHPALEEAQPMALIECMAAGLPVIGGQRSGGVPWTLDGGRAGLLVDVRNVGAIAAAMTLLADDPAQRQRLADTGRAHVRHTFHVDVIADAYQALYQELLEAAP